VVKCSNLEARIESAIATPIANHRWRGESNRIAIWSKRGPVVGFVPIPGQDARNHDPPIGPKWFDARAWWGWRLDPRDIWPLYGKRGDS